ncbi:uncharacterized protein DSM5745_07872 [Aspergillus mulundensis]|uniref:DUF7923 domain-containing protein n=1 Tax=Aspergillus mulundensis TaxID=1810919 RepID=A0A3D8RFF7_9EURO|nr:hypothetical protein DSM5745_07872 [Aspergillus mulundensis]RDW72700.1 hypothetical protein DSM5745_07872 [Aspergillus mulundensis]
MREKAQRLPRVAAKSWKSNAPPYKPGKPDAFRPATPLPESLLSVPPQARTRNYPETWKAPKVKSPKRAPAAPAANDSTEPPAPPGAANGAASNQMASLLGSIKAQQEQRASYTSLVQTVDDNYKNQLEATMSYHQESQQTKMRLYEQCIDAMNENKSDILSAIADVFNKWQPSTHSSRQGSDALDEDKVSHEEIQAFLSRKFDDNPKSIAIRLAHEQMAYYMVVVDGDAMKFNPEFIRQGYDGGRRLAKEFRNKVRQYLEEVRGYSRATRRNHTPAETILRVFASVKGLKKMYREAGYISSDDVFDAFIQGFNLNVNCDFIDVGTGPDRADTKVKNSGYAPVLAKAKPTQSRISLVKATPFAPLLQAFTDTYSTATFPDIFMSDEFENTKPPSLRDYDKIYMHQPSPTDTSGSRLAAIERKMAQMIDLLQEPRTNSLQSTGQPPIINHDSPADFPRPLDILDVDLDHQSSSRLESVTEDIKEEDGQDNNKTRTLHGAARASSPGTPAKDLPGHNSEDPEPSDKPNEQQEARNPEHADAYGQASFPETLDGKREFLEAWAAKLDKFLSENIESHAAENARLHSHAMRQRKDWPEWERMAAMCKKLSKDPDLKQLGLVKQLEVLHKRIQNGLDNIKTVNVHMLDNVVKSNYHIQVDTRITSDIAKRYRSRSKVVFNLKANKAAANRSRR